MPRPTVMQFARAMEAKLVEHDDRPGWQHCTLGWLMKRLDEERKELDEAVSMFLAQRHCGGDPDESAINRAGLALIGELADVGNFAMMMTDRVRVLMGGDQ